MFGSDSPVGKPSFKLGRDQEATIIGLVVDGAKYARTQITSRMREEKITRLVRLAMVRSKKERGINNIRIQGEFEIDDLNSPGDVTGRIDLILIYREWMHDENAYFGIECKKIDGQDSKESYKKDNAYVAAGMTRFADCRYCASHEVAMMLAYLLRPTSQAAFNRIELIATSKFGNTAKFAARAYPLGAAGCYQQVIPRASGREIKLIHLAVEMFEAA